MAFFAGVFVTLAFLQLARYNKLGQKVFDLYNKFFEPLATTAP